MRIKIISLFGVFYSSNLGDGLIGDCEEYIIRNRYKNVDVNKIDMSFRQGYNEDVYVQRRKKQINIFHNAPEFLKAWLVIVYLLPKLIVAMKMSWSDLVRQSDLVMIGGGQLFQNNSFNYPLKIIAILLLAKMHRKPVAFYACGFSSNWSFVSKLLMSNMLKISDIVFITFRDHESIRQFKKTFPSHVENIDLVPDAAFCVDEVYSDQLIVRCKNNYKIALGVASPKECTVTPVPGEAQLSDIYQKLICRLAENGCLPVLFTNGSVEDDQKLSEILKLLPKDVRDELHVVLPRKPDDLIAVINSADIVVSPRLHACIAAVALNKKIVGVVWDKKFDHLNELFNQKLNLISTKHLDADSVYTEIFTVDKFNETANQVVVKTLIEDHMRGLDHIMSKVGIEKRVCTE